ncbi:Sialic acid-binding [Collichthys lucidus]|uniref:Sialic acid-binding n=1 Tax=Collichthys lucidus TaxID=240159 RepID=A0A4U5V3P3_COLLU|nr:Sialic acid-binding [Collichthys lucidus]
MFFVALIMVVDVIFALHLSHVTVTVSAASRSIRARDASLGERKEHCQNGFCITLNEAEITAEAGLCVVIPCSFTTVSNFLPKNIVWYKCDAWKSQCSDSDRIFHTNKNKANVQPGFRGRVSLLEPDVNQRNCSIIINDLTESDSGSYQLRVNGLLYTYQYTYKPDGFTFTPRATISVKDLMQKPTLMIPPLTAGKQTTLTCTAPGLCSGSVPQITWTWRGEGENDTHITGNVTAVRNESVTSVALRYSSTLTFEPSAEHHGTSVTCKVGFRNNITAEETVTLNVTLFPKILKDSGCKVQSGLLTCVCISQGFPLPTVKWPLLEKLAEYSVFTTVSNHTINSTITLTVKDHSNATVQCVSRNEKGEVQQNINIMVTSEGQEGPVQQCSAVLPWAVAAAVSLIVNVICIICVMLLWNSRKKVKPNREDRTYMSLKKTDVSPEYDVIGQAIHPDSN